MKSLFTLLLTCMISLSLMAQQDIKEFKKQRYAKKHHKSFSSFENRMSRNPDHAPKTLLNEYRTIQSNPLKSESADMQKMDSMVYEDYDTVTQQWIVTDKEIFTYDSKGNMIQWVGYEFDIATMKMLPTFKEDLTFDANGNLTLYLFYEWDQSTGQWVNSGKWEDTFDGNNKVIKEIFYSWDTITNQWVPDFQYEMTYDTGGNLTTELGSYPDTESSSWIPFSKDEYTYIENEVQQILESIYYEDAEMWINWYRTTSTYDASFKLETEISEEWDFENSKWINLSKWEYTWDAQGMNTEEVEFEWDDGSQIWLNTWKYAYTYDQNKNMTEEVDSEWYNNQWNNDWRGVWAYNLSYTFLDLLVPYWFLYGEVDMTFVNMPVSLTEYWPELAAWVLRWRQIAYWSAFTSTDVNDIKTGKINVFPNPASEYITVTWDDNQPRLDLEVIDLAGKQVISRTVDKNAKINIGELSKGLYLYRLSDNGNVVYTGKISLK